MGVTDDLGLRLPEVEWSFRANAGELAGLRWVDTRLDPQLPPARAHGENGSTTFRYFAPLEVTPTYVREETLDAQGRGRPTAWEGLALLFAKSGWTVEARGFVWAPYSPYPGVLSRMVEAFGVERAMHRFDPGRLSRLAAMLPTWYPSRGRLDAARAVLAACDALATADETWGQDEPPPADALRDEVLCCHDAKWWRARKGRDAQPSYRLEKGFLRFQPAEGDGFGMRREDFLLVLDPSGKLSLAMHRLLPAWASVRITTNPGTEPTVVPEAKPQADQAPVPEEPQPAQERPKDDKGAKSQKKSAKAAKKSARAAKKPAEADVQDALVPVEEDEGELLAVGEDGDVVELDLEDFDLIDAEGPPTDPIGETGETETPAPEREASKNDKPGEK